jgi:hypothetical protein
MQSATARRRMAAIVRHPQEVTDIHQVTEIQHKLSCFGVRDNAGLAVTRTVRDRTSTILTPSNLARAGGWKKRAARFAWLAGWPGRRFVDHQSGRTHMNDKMLIEELEARYEMALPLDSECTSKCSPE